MPEIKDCINGILEQSVEVSKILVIDSGSTDGSIEYLRTISKVQLQQVAPESFNHGETRNLGWQLCNEDFLLYTVQDAKPADDDWIKKMLEGFDDKTVAGVCGQQVVSHERDKNPVDWFMPSSADSTVKYQFDRPQDFSQLSPFQKKNVCSWDDVNAMYRRDVLSKIPFQKVSFGEDMLWAKDALMAGYAIVYNNAAKVYHYHYEDYNFTFKRYLTTSYFRYRNFGFLPVLPPDGWVSRLRLFKQIFIRNDFNLGEKVKWWKYNITQRRAFRKAASVFFHALHEGEEKLDAAHQEYCSVLPAPGKK